MDTTETFDVVIVGFGTHEQTPQERLQRAFGVNDEVGGRLLERLPATVQRGVPRIRAEYFRRALVLIAAEVEVRDASGRVVPEPPPEPFAPAPRDASPSVVPPGVSLEAGALRLDGLGAARPPSYQSPPSLAPAASRFAEPRRTGLTVDPMSETLAAHAPVSPAPEPLTAAKASAPHDGLRAPAHPTLKEGAAPVLQAARLAPAPRPAPAPAQPPAFAWDAPNFGTLSAPDASLLPRTPSSVWDPPPVPRVADSPNPALGPGIPRPAPPVFDVAPHEIPSLGPNPPASGPANFDMSRSMAASEFWRNAPAGGPKPTALTLDDDPNQGPFDVLSNWQRAHMDELAAPTQERSPAKARPRPDDAARSRRAVGVAAASDAAALSAAPAKSRRPQPGSERLGGALAAGPASARVIAAPGLASAHARAAGGQESPHSSRSREVPASEARAPASGADDPVPAVPAVPGRDGRVPAAVGVSARFDRQASLSGADLRSFWETMGDALALPFRGPAIYWLAGITGWAIAVGVLGFFAGFVALLGVVVAFFANTSLLGVTCDFYRECLWAPATGQTMIKRSLDFDPVRVMQVYVKSGMHLMFFTIVSQIPVIVWLVNGVLGASSEFDLYGLLLDPITWLLLLVPYFYWPMGVGIAALSNDFGAIWNVAAGCRAIARAPFEYSVIFLIGVLVLFVSWGGLLLFGSVLGVAGSLASSTIGFPLALSHGIQGALMGHLVRARPETFE